MNDDTTRSGVEQDADLGEPNSGPRTPHETNALPPFVSVPWQPPSRASRMLSTGITLTIRFVPTAIFIWMVGPDELKYQVRKQVRWLPYLAKYAAWWLRQEGW
jgi:hypothetical protein